MKKQIKFVLFLALNLSSNELQEAINSANIGDVIELSSGEYKGNILINKPLTLDGLDKSAIIIGEGKDSVISVSAPNVTIRNLTIKNSGLNHSKDDSAIKASEAHGLLVQNNLIKDTLFGVTLLKTNEAKIEHNQISSKGEKMGLRGDAIKLWYSHSNQILDNNISNARDMVFWYSSANFIARNYGKNCRYSLHFMYSNSNLIEHNIFESNSVGMFFMFSRDSTARYNVIKNADGAYGVGIGMKDSSNFKILNNKLIYNARGFYLDQSPYQPGSVNLFEGNEIAYNGIGVQFHAAQEKSIFEKNSFKGNMEVALNDTPESKLLDNQWRGNFFDDYDGFDRDKDGTGDVAYASYAYADQLWQHRPSVRFFYGSAGIALLNFLAKLAPFSEPALLLRDETPRMKE